MALACTPSMPPNSSMALHERPDRCLVAGVEPVGDRFAAVTLDHVDRALRGFLAEVTDDDPGPLLCQPA
jgi:hypothetical protein